MLSTLTNEGLLVWMPAHQALNMVGEAKRSDLKRLTVVDRRANRLVDALAKLEAKRRDLPLAVDRLLSSACLRSSIVRSTLAGLPMLLTTS